MLYLYYDSIIKHDFICFDSFQHDSYDIFIRYSLYNGTISDLSRKQNIRVILVEILG